MPVLEAHAHTRHGVGPFCPAHMRPLTRRGMGHFCLTQIQTLDVLTLLPSQVANQYTQNAYALKVRQINYYIERNIDNDNLSINLLSKL